jgi:hypothetical protein
MAREQGRVWHQEGCDPYARSYPPKAAPQPDEDNAILDAVGGEENMNKRAMAVDGQNRLMSKIVDLEAEVARLMKENVGLKAKIGWSGPQGSFGLCGENEELMAEIARLKQALHTSEGVRAQHVRDKKKLEARIAEALAIIAAWEKTDGGGIDELIRVKEVLSEPPAEEQPAPRLKRCDNCKHGTPEGNTTRCTISAGTICRGFTKEGLYTGIDPMTKWEEQPAPQPDIPKIADLQHKRQKLYEEASSKASNKEPKRASDGSAQSGALVATGEVEIEVVEEQPAPNAPQFPINARGGNREAQVAEGGRSQDLYGSPRSASEEGGMWDGKAGKKPLTLADLPKDIPWSLNAKMNRLEKMVDGMLKVRDLTYVESIKYQRTIAKARGEKWGWWQERKWQKMMKELQLDEPRSAESIKLWTSRE